MTVRPLAAAAFVAGLLLLVEGIVQLGYTQPEAGWGPPDVLFEVGFACALAASLIAVRGVPLHLRSGRVSRVGAIVAQVGFGLLLITSIASAIARRDELGPVFPIGLLVVAVGLLVLAISGALTGRPRWLAVVPFVGFVLSVVLPLPGVGDIALGLSWVVVGSVLAVRTRTAPVPA
jgi:hypothetical protein